MPAFEKNPPLSPADFESYMNSPLKSSNRINLNIPRGTVGGVSGGITGGLIGYSVNKENQKKAKEMCTALSTDCVGNPTKPPAQIKQALNKERAKTAKNTLMGMGIGSTVGYAIDKATSNKGLKIGKFNLKIG